MKSLFVLSLLLVGFVAATPLPDVPEKPEDVKPLLIGQTIPDITFATVEGATVSLRAEVAKKPTILVFYRGGWCPFCSKQLAELGSLQPELTKMGYQIVAVSTDSPENLKATMDKSALAYTLLSDADVAGATAFGLAFKAPERYGEMLVKASGGKNKAKLLPVPAVFVLDQKGIIKFEYVNPDFKQRLSAKVLKAAAEAA